MKRLLLLLCLAGMPACTVGPDYHPPRTDAPAAWGATPAEVPSRSFGGAVDSGWWQSFRDPELTALVQRLAAQNLDLKAAAERVAQGDDQRRAAAAQGLPMINENARYRFERQSPNGTLALLTPAPGAPYQYDLFHQGLNASWQLDLFGRVRRAVEAADANTVAVQEARHGIALAALASLADSYMQLRGVQAQRVVTEQNRALAQDSLALVRNRFANGVATTLDVANAQAQLATIDASLPPLHGREARLINAIGILLAEPPRALQAELSPPAAQPPVPPAVPVGLPGTLVRQRPDLREAEARLHAATAETGVAAAQFYPDISLSGSFGTESLRFTDIFNLPSRSFSLGPTIDIPIFEGGRLKAELHLRQSQQREAAIDFQRTVLRAWQEVDDALTDYAQAQRRRARIAEAVGQNTTALQAARQRYAEGAVDFLNVLSAQNALLQSQGMLVDSDTTIETSLIALYRALGGGWEIADAH